MDDVSMWFITFQFESKAMQYFYQVIITRILTHELGFQTSDNSELPGIWCWCKCHQLRFHHQRLRERTSMAARSACPLFNAPKTGSPKKHRPWPARDMFRAIPGIVLFPAANLFQNSTPSFHESEHVLCLLEFFIWLGSHAATGGIWRD